MSLLKARYTCYNSEKRNEITRNTTDTFSTVTIHLFCSCVLSSPKHHTQKNILKARIDLLICKHKHTTHILKHNIPVEKIKGVTGMLEWKINPERRWWQEEKSKQCATRKRRGGVSQDSEWALGSPWTPRDRSQKQENTWAIATGAFGWLLKRNPG